MLFQAVQNRLTLAAPHLIFIYMEVIDAAEDATKDSTNDVCRVFIFNPVLVDRIKGQIDGVSTIATLFKMLGDESRCTILMALNMSDELCVCDLSEITGLAMPTVSHHLRKLRERGLVVSRREGKLVFYRLEGEDAKVLLDMAARKVLEPA